MESCLYFRPTDSESLDPGWVLLTVRSEKRWFRGPAPSSCGCTLPRYRPPGRTRGCGHLEPRPLQAMLWAPGPQNPCSQRLCPPPSWDPCPSPTGVYGHEERGLRLDLKAGGALDWTADCSRHREGQSQRWEEQGEGWGLGRPLPLLSWLLAWSSVSKTPVFQVLVVM